VTAPVARRAPLEEQPLTVVPGVGPALAGRLQRLGLATVQDLLFHLPLRYEDRTRIVPIGALRPGERVAVEGELQHVEVAHRRRRSLLAHLRDGSGGITLRFFHFSRAQQELLARGARLRAFGEVRPGPSGPEMVHPEYQILRGTEDTTSHERLTPIYPTPEGLAQSRLRALAQRALALLDRHGIADLLDRSELEALPSLAEALHTVHEPPADAALELFDARRHPAQRRLAFEELLAHHLSLRRLRLSIQAEAAPPLLGDGELRRRLRSLLPFALTAAQERVIAEVERDLARPTPMLRLVQGDVGSGKTVLAALATLLAVEAGYQCALMAPTELLADQHLATFHSWLDPLDVRVASLSGRQGARERRIALGDVELGNASVVVGTHALFQEGVSFRALGLVIVDEQHRFGVHQRLALREKGASGGTAPHQLIMTATPIPRTLAMTAYADLDFSVVDELPPGRLPVKTVALPAERRSEVIERVRAACAQGRQAYWVCPLIEESDTLDAAAAEETAAALADLLPELRIVLLHGRMSAREREQVMGRFKRGEVQLLVATTVIEVGVDVPNASLMIVENAERMGLAQLHQLRGRVGRGDVESACVLLYRAPLSEHARARLAVLRESPSGFVVARTDLELRGPGEVLGTRQTGLLQLRVADLIRDADLLPGIQRLAEALLREPDGARVDALVRRWVGEADRYGRV
jgi:ATP-dependent DNA helicase RecG